MLIAQQRSDVRKMPVDLEVCSAKYGLKIHFGKTKVMTWRALVRSPHSLAVGSNTVDILDQAASEKYLGRKLCFEDSQATELRNRIACGWGSFHKHKNELCSKFYSLQDRCRLFDAVVTPSILYACATWALTQKMEKKLITVRRRMLRYVFRLHKMRTQGPDSPLEDWVEFVQRTAHRVDAIAEDHCMDDWVIQYRRRKWRFVGKTARCDDKRWSQIILNWTPNFGFGRSRGAPKTRWSDQLVKFAGGDWMSHAQNEDQWCSSEDIFANWTF